MQALYKVTYLLAKIYADFFKRLNYKFLVPHKEEEKKKIEGVARLMKKQ